MNYVRFIVTVLTAVFSFQELSAQSNYVTHTLKQGESLSALAKEYNTSVGDIMRLNGMHADTKLVYGSQIKIPSTQKQVAKKVVITPAPTVTQSSAASSDEITHIVAKGETLYSISKKYNVSVDQIKAWNHLTDNSAKLGTLLIISEHGNNKFVTTPVAKQQNETITSPQPKEPVAVNDSATVTENNSVPVTEDKPSTAADDVTNNIQPAMQTVNNMSNTSAPDEVSKYSEQGFFTAQFKEKNMQKVSGISKTFKTASGWADGKYYILANNIDPGTIVKITADNGNSVYAKVLWNMGDLKDNAGINFRISNATAAALHESNDSFNISVSF